MLTSSGTGYPSCWHWIKVQVIYGRIKGMEEKVMKDCKVLALCSQKGGVGKTTSCVNLAVGLAKAGEKVLVIDNDP